MALEERLIAPFPYYYSGILETDQLRFKNSMVVLIKNGIVLQSWKDDALPDAEELNNFNQGNREIRASAQLFQGVIERMDSRSDKWMIFVLLLFLGLSFILLNPKIKKNRD